MKPLILILFTFSTIMLSAQQRSINNDEENLDMLTPAYYLSTTDSTFISELDTFLYFARMVPFQLPFIDSTGSAPDYSIGRSFGEGIGPGGTGSHHPAIDYYMNSTAIKVNLYAPCDGFVEIDSSVDRYRHFVSITHEINDSSGHSLGKMKVILAHIDLDLDALDGILPHGNNVKKGTLISGNLYSGTRGGPHLHMEIRYYRSTDAGYEDFYGGQVGEKISPSDGPWTYGYWDPNCGYGFAHPLNHINQTSLDAVDLSSPIEIQIYPNPFRDRLTIHMRDLKSSPELKIFDVFGRNVFYLRNIQNEMTSLDLNKLEAGLYFVQIENDRSKMSSRIIKY